MSAAPSRAPAFDQAAGAPLAADAAHSASAAPFGPGLSAVLQERLRQIEQHGHTPQADAAVPLPHFFFVLERLSTRVIHRQRTDAPAFVLRKQLVALAAFALAMIDRLDAETPASSDKQGAS